MMSSSLVFAGRLKISHRPLDQMAGTIEFVTIAQVVQRLPDWMR